MDHLTFTAASRRHGVRRHQIREVLDDATTLVLQTYPVDEDHPDERFTLVGPDAADTLFEIGVVETETGLLVIHAMEARRRYRRLFEEQAP